LNSNLTLVCLVAGLLWCPGGRTSLSAKMFSSIKVGRPVTYIVCLSRGFCSEYGSLFVLLFESGGSHIRSCLSVMSSLDCNAVSTNPYFVPGIKP